MRRPTSEPPELPGYTFVKVLGSGGFSDVFLYDQQLPRRRVAVKVLLTEELTDSSQAAFVAEANLMAQLSAHPYIVTIYQAGVAGDDRPYFVMEYCSGPSLADRYKRETFDVADALRTGVRLSSAVATAHSAGILHRDIKPANVLGNDYGWPALTDFGISSAVDEGLLPVDTTTLSGVGDTSGTSASVGLSVPWSPAEMFDDDPQPDVRSDVFSLAATIYTILAGRTPFEVPGRANGTLDLIGRIERGAITPMSRTDIPRSLLAVLQKGMATEREDRFATAVDFARALQRVELELGYAPTPIEVPNLTVAAPERDADGGDEADETRVRSVATIEAQARPVAPQQPVASADATVVRSATVIEGQESAPASTPTAAPMETVVRRREPVVAEEPLAPVEELPAPAPRSRKVAAWIAGAAAAVVVGAIVAGVMIFGPTVTDPLEPAKPEPGASTDPVIVESVPSPELVGEPAVDGSALVITVKNPDPRDGDVIQWRVSNLTTDVPTQRLDGDVIRVEGFDGNRICIEAHVVRAGKQSANPLEVCYP